MSNNTLAEIPQDQIVERPKSSATIKELLNGEEFKRQVAIALPKHLQPDRFVRVALTAMTRTPKLATCDRASFFNALLTLSQLGIEPDGRLAHLIPFENRKRNCTECQLIIDYKGLVELAMRSGNVANIHADKVCENDLFEFDRGAITKHKVDFKQPRGKAYAYYALVRFKDGTEKCEVMTLEEVNAIRSRSRASSSGPWVTDFDEMGKKTAFRRLSKWIQLSPEFRDALEHDADAVDRNRFDSAKMAVATSEPINPFAAETITVGPGLPMPYPQNADYTEPPPFVPDTPQKQLQVALSDAGVVEAKFIATFKKQAGALVGKAKLVAELSDDAANAALAEINDIIALCEGGAE